MLDFFEEPVHRSLHLGGQSEDVPAVMLTRGFDFGRSTLLGMISLIENGPSMWICVPTVCRPFFELSAKLLWAAREPDGWVRLQADTANEQIKWARDVERFKPFAVYARRMHTKLSAVTEQRSLEGKSELPNLRMLLGEIEAKDRDGGIGTLRSDFALFQYAMMYRLMCGPAHGHLVWIAKKGDLHLTIAVSAAIASTYALLRAVAAVFSHTPESCRELVEIIGTKINKILQGTSDFRLDDLTIVIPE